MNEHYGYEPNSGGLDRWPSQLDYTYFLSSTERERTQPTCWFRWPAFPFDGASQDQQFLEPHPHAWPQWTTGTTNPANNMGLMWDARGHRSVRVTQGASGGLNTASGVKFGTSRLTITRHNVATTSNWFIHVRFRPSFWPGAERTVFGLRDYYSTVPPKHGLSLLMHPTQGRLIVRYIESVGGATTDFGYTGFTPDAAGYYDVGIMRWYLDANRSKLHLFNHGVEVVEFDRPKQFRLRRYDQLEIGMHASGKDTGSFPGRISAFSLWRDPMRNRVPMGNGSQWPGMFARDAWWFLRGPEYPWEEIPEPLPCLHADVSSTPALSASLASRPALSAFMSGRGSLSGSLANIVALDAGIPSVPTLSGSLGAQPAIGADLASDAALSASVESQPSLAADVAARPALAANVRARGALSASLSAKPALSANVRRC